MTSLVDAMRQKDTVTENGMLTNSTSLDANVDLFFTIGAMRGQDIQRLHRYVSQAWNENIQTALRILFYGRDAREGAGERQVFKDAISYLIDHDNEGALRKNMHLVPEYGRWDDLEVFFDTPYEKDALDIIKKALEDENALCAKWMRRRGKNFHRVRKHIPLSSSNYRTLLSSLSNTVEAHMAAKNRSEIDYGKIPSLAAARYQKAFMKNDPQRYQFYKEGLEEGTETINAGAIYPYDVLKSVRFGDDKVAQAQRNALPDYLKDSDRRILPMCDVSESMITNKAGKNLNCMDVCLSLGLYISERNNGKFKDAFLTFTDRPTIQVLSGTLSQRMNQIRGPVGYNTNFENAFNYILNHARTYSVTADEMPTDILVLSDMEFDHPKVGGFTAQELIKRKYNEAGYIMPNIVYRNLQSRHDNMPVKFDEKGTALVSGFSPSILEAILAGEDMTPVGIMNKKINSPRYQAIQI